MFWLLLIPIAGVVYRLYWVDQKLNVLLKQQGIENPEPWARRTAR